MNGLSLCSGIGGLDLGIHLAAEALGLRYRTICYLERETYCVEVLKRRIAEKSLDDAPIWDDLRTFDGRAWRGCVSLIHAGLPCQPYSVAGKRKGDKDERYIWDDFFRIVREVQAALVFLENVPGLLTWFQPIGEELSSMGFKFEAGLFSAEEVGAPHKRERLFILGNSKSGSECRQQENKMGAGTETKDRWQAHHNESYGSDEDLPEFPPGPSHPRWADIIRARPDLAPAVANARHPEPSRRDETEEDPNKARSELKDVQPASQDGHESEATQPEVRMLDDGFSHWMDRVNENRVDRLRGLGNAVVPQCAAKAFTELYGRLF